jgi:PAS domain S-box-containing protein
MAGMSAPLRDVLITEELVHRSVREPNYKAENSTLQELAEALAQEPQDLLERLPQMAVDLCHADSAVLSILENAGGEETFRWATAAGKLREYRGRVCRRLSSFSASCLERGTPQLYSFPTRSYSDAADLPLTLTEVLVVPLHMQSDGAGTLWIAHHDASRQFDATDMRIMLTLVAFGAGAVSVLKSMTERRHAESEQRESEDHFRAIADAAPVLIWSAAPDQSFDYFNQRWSDFAGRATESEIRSWLAADAVHPDDRERRRDAYGASFTERRRIQIEYRLLRHDGTYRWMLDQGAPRFDRTGKFLGYVGSCLDITEQKQHEDQVRQSQKLESLGVLAGGIAHDFNNLLTGILGNASLGLDSVPSESPLRPRLQDIIEASERAANLTKQLLAYAGKGRFFIEPLDISALVRGIGHLLESSIPKSAQLRMALATDLPCVVGDVSQLQQLVMNLVMNGAEAIAEGENGTVLVAVGAQEIDDAYIQSTIWTTGDLEPGRYVTLEVQDDGCGMDEPTIARIFDPFFTTKFTGRGLGLAAVMGIVRGHKGALKVYSTPGRGTTFKVLLPASDQTPVRDVDSDPGLWRGAGIVLVIDDEAVVRRTAKASLVQYGYSVVLAENGLEGVARFREMAERIALVLLDMTMPVMGGEEALRQLRLLNPNVPIILSSGYNEVETIRRFTGKGLAGFIQKPYTSTQLAKTVKDVLNRK